MLLRLPVVRWAAGYMPAMEREGREAGEIVTRLHSAFPSWGGREAGRQRRRTKLRCVARDGSGGKRRFRVATGLSSSRNLGQSAGQGAGP